MKNTIKNCLLIPALSVAAALTLASCSDWTDPEGLDVKTPSIDAGLQADYLKSLNSYKAGAHKVVFVTYDNASEYPIGQFQHLTTLPDSLDFISLNNPDELHEVVVKEMTEVRKKGTRVIYNIDFPTFESEWVQLLKEDKEGTLTEEDALAFFTARTNEMLALCDKWGYDGITFTYMGRALVSLHEDEIPAHDARQKSFLEPIAAWKQSHASKSISFFGNPHFLFDANKTVLAQCDYIILPSEKAPNAEDLTVRALAAVNSADVPADRIVVSAETTRPDDDKMLYGYFGSYDEAGNRIRSVYGCAKWVAQPSSGFTRAGMMIRQAQFDYFDSSLAYRRIREAIGIMNPSPKN